MDAVSGYLVIKDIPDETCREKIRDFLIRTVKNVDRERLDSLLVNTPLTLKGKIPEKIGKKIARKLQAFGATVVFQELDDKPAADKRKSGQKIQFDATPATAGLEPKEQPVGKKEFRSGPESLSEPLSEPPIKEKGIVDESPPGLNEKPSKEPLVFPQYNNVAPSRKAFMYRIADQIADVNKELWIIFTMVAIVGLMNYIVASKYMILGLYSFPTLLSAYFYGRRHAVMTAILTIIMVGVVVQFNDVIFSDNDKFQLAAGSKWYHIMAWGSVLICTAYAMGTLYERHMEKVKELRKTYQGLIVILRHFISKDQYTENHCYRVSIYAAKIASYLGLDEEAIEDIRSAGLLHDIGKLKVSRELLYKAAKLSEAEYKEIQKHVSNSETILEPLKGPLGRIIPIILAHHDRYDGKGYGPNKGTDIPLGARILAVADVYDALTSDRPYRKAMAPLEAKEIIVKGSGKDFDPVVVKAFLKAFERGDMDIPNFVV